MLLTGKYPVAALIAAASVGNVLGSLINWLLGRGIEQFREHRWFPVKPAQLDKAQRWYQKYGKWSLLMSWAPLIGDPLTIAAGMMREPLWIFVSLVGIAKTCRYLVITAIVLNWSSGAA